MQSLISVDFKVVFTCSGKPIGAQPHLSAVWLMFPLSQFQFCSDWWWPFLSLSNYAKSDEESSSHWLFLLFSEPLPPQLPSGSSRALLLVAVFMKLWREHSGQALHTVWTILPDPGPLLWIFGVSQPAALLWASFVFVIVVKVWCVCVCVHKACCCCCFLVILPL